MEQDTEQDTAQDMAQDTGQSLAGRGAGFGEGRRAGHGVGHIPGSPKDIRGQLLVPHVLSWCCRRGQDPALPCTSADAAGRAASSPPPPPSWAGGHKAPGRVQLDF